MACRVSPKRPRRSTRSGPRSGTASPISRLPKAEQGLSCSFARGLRADRKAVVAAMEEPWPNGHAEGQFNRLKTPKRQMHGRARLDLLRASMVAA
jgi:transposase